MPPKGIRSQRISAKYILNLTVKVKGNAIYSHEQPNGLDQYEVALYVCPNDTDNGIHSDDVDLDTREIP